MVPRYRYRRRKFLTGWNIIQVEIVRQREGKKPKDFPIGGDACEGLRKQPADLCPVISHSWASPQILPYCPGRDRPATDATINHPTPSSSPFPGWRHKVRAKGSCSQPCPIWEVLPLKIQ